MNKLRILRAGTTLALIGGVIAVMIFTLNDEGGKKTIEMSGSPEIEKEQIEKVGSLVREDEKPAGSSAPEAGGMKDESVPKTAKDDQAPIKKAEAGKNDAKINITNRLASWGFEKTEARKIDTIVVHSSYNSLGGDEYDVEKIIAIYKDYEVAAHYIIGRNGKTYRLVADSDIAYHAGQSKMPDGRTGVNEFSIGIEMVNNKSDKMTADQYVALNSLIADLKDKYGIKYILGHSDIAPGRKDDPWGMEWGKVKK